ncbi:MAG: hypothetical protein VYA71_03405 [Pseudomonadota bacterium]|nr:hypothetical protein [Pseudomonadota bacterium]
MPPARRTAAVLLGEAIEARGLIAAAAVMFAAIGATFTGKRRP